MKKNKINIYLIIIIYSLFLFFPIIIYDPDIEYEVIRRYHTWLTPYVYQLIYFNSKEFGVSTSEICGLIKEESGGNPNAISVANARGLCQIIGKYHYNGDANNLFDESLNIHLGIKILNDYLKMAKGDLKLALRYYNAGPYASYYNNWGYINKIIYHSKTTKHLLNKHIIVV